MLSLIRKYQELQRLCLTKNDPDLADIINGIGTYSPREVDANQTSYRLYDMWLLSDIEEKAKACGVYPGQLAQILILRSIITCDFPEFGPAMERLSAESRRWDRWMAHRRDVMEVTFARWESSDE